MSRRIYRFGQYSVDPATRELRCAGELIALSPTLFDCLAWLIEHRDRAVGRDELVAAVWGKSHIADTQLVQAILKARRAVGDTGEGQHAIRTIPRFGYRWVAATDVEDVDADAPVATRAENAPMSALDHSETNAVRAKRPRLAMTAFVAIAIAAAGAVAWFALASRATHTATPTRADIATTAVLPADVGDDHEWRWLRLGLMDLVADRLRESGLSVVPSDNVVSLVRDAGDGDAALRAVHEAIAPRWIVRPAARRGAPGWTVSLELRDAERRLVVEASAADPASAAREAALRLLPMLGRTDARGVSANDDDLAPRVRAAILADDYETAERWLGGATPAQAQTPEIRVLRAQTDFGTGRFDTARSRFATLLGDVGENADPILRARILKGRGASAIRLGDAASAERDFSAVIDLVPAGDTSSLAGDAFSGRGVARAMQGRADEAMADFARARIALKLVGDTLGLAGVEMNEGALNAQRGHPAESLASFRSAAEHFERFGARADLALAIANEIEAHLRLLEPTLALEVADRAEIRLVKLEDPSARRLVTYWHASALAAVGRLAEATEQLDQLIRASGARDDTGVLAMSRHRKSALALSAGRIEDAVALAGQAVADTEGAPWNDVRAEAWLTLTRGLRAQGRDADAAREVERFDAWSRALGDRPVQILATLALAEQAWSERHRDAAAADYATALSLAEQGAVPADIAAVGVSWGTTLIAEGDLEAAGPVVGRVARWASSDFACAVLQANLYRALGQPAAWEAALAQARTLAGERAVPASAAAAPLISSR